MRSVKQHLKHTVALKNKTKPAGDIRLLVLFSLNCVFPTRGGKTHIEKVYFFNHLIKLISSTIAIGTINKKNAAGNSIIRKTITPKKNINPAIIIPPICCAVF